MKRQLALPGLALLLAAWGCGPKPAASTDNPPEPPAAEASQAIESARIDESIEGIEKPLYATVGGEEVMVADNAMRMWLSDDMKTLYYSYNHAKSGFEAEGQGVMRWRPDMDRPELVFDDDAMVVDVKEGASAAGKTALIVHLEDGGLGASTVSIADPERGRVFRSTNSTAEILPGGKVKVSTYDVDQWAAHHENGSEGMPEPTSSSEYDLDELLGMDASRDIINPWPGE